MPILEGFLVNFQNLDKMGENLHVLLVVVFLELMCPDGTEWQAHSPAGCYPCRVGTYRSGNDSQLCHYCPDGQTTPTVGAKTQDLCGQAEVKDYSNVFVKGWLFTYFKQVKDIC